jgi:UDP-hydrolysing UDP-N-acetyl-D-glucosamine 2-epimerase
MRVCVILTARPSWAKLEPVCRALKAMPDVELQLVCCASALLERYGKVVEVVKAQGYPVAAEVWSTYEGANLLTSAKETGGLLSDLSGVLQRLQPDVVCVCADRHEVLAAAQSAAYLHLPLVHLQGGERSGSIDDKIRDAITQLADYHCVATERAKYRVYGLTGALDRVFNTGCPSIDLAKEALSQPPVTVEELGGAGAPIDLSQPFAVVLQHPVTEEADQAAADFDHTLGLLRWCEMPTLAFWPGQDAGAEAMSKVLRGYQDTVHTVRNLPPVRFLRLLTQAAVLIGNSSAGIREASYLGVPVINLGTRQHGRERGPNVIDADVLTTKDLELQMMRGFYPRSPLYGSGTAGSQIAKVIVDLCTDTSQEGQQGRATEELQGACRREPDPACP